MNYNKMELWLSVKTSSVLLLQASIKENNANLVRLNGSQLFTADTEGKVGLLPTLRQIAPQWLWSDHAPGTGDDGYDSSDYGSWWGDNGFRCQRDQADYVRMLDEVSFGVLFMISRVDVVSLQARRTAWRPLCEGVRSAKLLRSSTDSTFVRAVILPVPHASNLLRLSCVQRWPG